MSAYRPPRLVLTIDLESRGHPRIEADSHEEELRLRDWLRAALRRRESLSQALERYLDDLDAIENRQAA